MSERDVNLNTIQQKIETLPGIVFDAGLAAAVWGLGIVQLAGNHHPFDQERGGGPAGPLRGGPPGPHTADFWTYALLTGAAAFLVLSRKHPLLSLAAVTALAAVYLGRGESTFSTQFVYLVAIYSAVADSSLPRLAAVLTAAGAAAVLGVAILI